MDEMSAPGVFQQIPQQYLNKRVGEPCLWFRMMPTADIVEPGMMALPESKGARKGFVQTFQKTREVGPEIVQPQYIRGNKLIMREGPVESVSELYVQGDGERIPLGVRAIEGNSIFIEHPPFSITYRTVVARYDVAMVRREQVTARAVALGREVRVVTDPFDQVNARVMAAVHSVKIMRDGYGWEPAEQFSHNYHSVFLHENLKTGHEILVDATFTAPVGVSYRNFDVKQADIKGFNVTVGDLDVIVAPQYAISKGDALVFLKSTRVDKCISHLSNGRYRMANSPVAKVHSIVSSDNRELSLKDFAIEDFQYLRYLPDPLRPPKSLSIAYSHHPIYKIDSAVTFSGMIGESMQPNRWHAKADFTDSLFPGQKEYKEAT